MPNELPYNLILVQLSLILFQNCCLKRCQDPDVCKDQKLDLDSEVTPMLTQYNVSMCGYFFFCPQVCVLFLYPQNPCFKYNFGAQFSPYAQEKSVISTRCPHFLPDLSVSKKEVLKPLTMIVGFQFILAFLCQSYDENCKLL